MMLKKMLLALVLVLSSVGLIALGSFFLQGDAPVPQQATQHNANSATAVTRPNGGFFLDVLLVDTMGKQASIALPIRVTQGGALIEEKETTEGTVRFGLPSGSYAIEVVRNPGWSPMTAQLMVVVDADKTVKIRGEVNIGQ